jgi:hypothetical protein
VRVANTWHESYVDVNSQLGYTSGCQAPRRSHHRVLDAHGRAQMVDLLGFPRLRCRHRLTGQIPRNAGGGLKHRCLSPFATGPGSLGRE